MLHVYRFIKLTRATLTLTRNAWTLEQVLNETPSIGSWLVAILFKLVTCPNRHNTLVSTNGLHYATVSALGHPMDPPSVEYDPVAVIETATNSAFRLASRFSGARRSYSYVAS